ncbi:MAG: hypothetical protein Q9218_006199 [Villophora microphyllina]
MTVAEITGNRWLSPLRGNFFTNLTALVTATGTGAWIRSTQPDDDESTSESIRVYNLLFGYDFTVGDIVTFDGQIDEMKDWPLDLFYPVITYPHNARRVSKGNPVKPVLLGQSTSGIIGNKDMRPPTEQYNKLDNGDIFGFPNDVARVSEVDSLLEPTGYGMDFFQSLLGELVTIQNVTVLGRQARDHSIQGHHLRVYGNWPVTGSNARGGLTVTDRDANPEIVILHDPLDGTSNPSTTRLGDSLTDVTGVVDYITGQYYIRPRTAPSIKSSRSPPLPPPTAIKSNKRCNGLSVAEYNLEHFAPGDSRVPLIVNHIATYLGAPSIVFLQGVEASDNRTVDANVTLSDLTQALERRTGVPYKFIDVDPVNNKDDIVPNRNIRSAYLFNPREVRLHRPNPGNSTDVNAVLPGPSLRFNPGRIDAPPAFEYCRKPLIAQWETLDRGGVFFTVNVHLADKDGWITTQGDRRPPYNTGINQRKAQAPVIASFIAQILAQDRNAAVIAVGQFNEYAFVEPMKDFVQISRLQNLDIVSGIPEVERYTSNSGGGQEQWTHMFVSSSIARHVGKEDFAHVHVNTWASKEGIESEYDPALNEYDPSIARLNVCGH